MLNDYSKNKNIRGGGMEDLRAFAEMLDRKQILCKFLQSRFTIGSNLHKFIKTKTT